MYSGCSVKKGFNWSTWLKARSESWQFDSMYLTASAIS